MVNDGRESSIMNEWLQFDQWSVVGRPSSCFCEWSVVNEHRGGVACRSLSFSAIGTTHFVAPGFNPVPAGISSGYILLIGVREHSVGVQGHPVSVRKQPVRVLEHPIGVRRHSILVREHPIGVRRHPIGIRRLPIHVRRRPFPRPRASH